MKLNIVEIFITVSMSTLRNPTGDRGSGSGENRMAWWGSVGSASLLSSHSAAATLQLANIPTCCLRFVQQQHQLCVRWCCMLCAMLGWKSYVKECEEIFWKTFHFSVWLIYVSKCPLCVHMFVIYYLPEVATFYSMFISRLDNRYLLGGKVKL